MKPTVQDQQIFADMKAIFGKFVAKIGLQITDEGRADGYLFFTSRLFHPTENDLSIGYQTKAKMVRIVARILLPVPTVKRGDLLELFNHHNARLQDVRVNIDPATQFIHLRGEMFLFEGSLDQKNFEDVLNLFFAALTMLFPMIGDFLDGKTKREDIQETIDAKIKGHQKAT